MTSAATALLFICGLLVPLASSLPGSGRIFDSVNSSSAEFACPREFAILSLGWSPGRRRNGVDFLVEKRSLSNQTKELELSQLLSELQQVIVRHKLSFNVSETNRRLPSSLFEASDAKPRLCAPTYELDAGGVTRPRLPTFLLGVSCPHSCREVRRDVRIYKLLCDSEQPVYYSSAVSVAVDCAPEADNAWL